MATIKKAQKGMTMKQLKMKYPKADTMPSGDTRFQEFNAYAPKKFLKQVQDTDAAFDKKYGKGKPAKQKMGGVTKKKMQAGGVAGKQPKAPFITVQKRTIAGTKMAKKGMSIKKGMHKMPDGSMMKNSMMKKGDKMSKMSKKK
jgi:hypothetical protein